jgi:hypothetical protein
VIDIQNDFERFSNELKRRMLVDGEVFLVGGQFVDPKRITVRASNYEGPIQDEPPAPFGKTLFVFTTDEPHVNDGDIF